MDLIDRSKINFYKLTGPELKSAMEEAPSVPAVPLDKLCEWLEKNACYYQTEDNGGSTRFSLDACQWKIVLAKWMEEQDDQKET